ncbi:ecdysoneless cell cycle regulator [Dermatophagoides pteronyssinus]|uniref:ecdysoneless cell cycle regulator n=1 Tax=Dermatophagoides pteronyssinus TaxID=6956 RepID=UPI003F663457
MNFPETNTVHYHLYRRRGNLDGECPSSLIDRYLKHLSKHLDGYIWHNECFHLKQKSYDQQTEQYLFGQCNYGENIDDEWFIVFLLKLLTEFDDQLFVRIQDEDGEFLLIESADYLPRWAQEPSRTVDRVFIYRGKIHLVSSKFVEKDLNKRKFIWDCIRFIESNPKQTELNQSIQHCIQNRIEIFQPINIQRLYHNAHCLLPISLVILLDYHPELISAAIRSYYYRTPDDLKTIGTNHHRFNNDQKILTNVRFTRCLYAQLASQDVDDVQKLLSPSSSSNDNHLLNGVKIIAGFEILLQNSEMMKNTVESKAGKVVNEFLTTILTEELIAEFLKNKTSLPPEDDDSWLNIDSEQQFDDLLNEKFNQQQSSSKTNDNFVENIPKTLEKFFQNQNSGIDGVEPPPALPNDKSTKPKSSKFNLIEEFDEKEFVEFFRKMAQTESDNSEESNSDDDDDTDDDDCNDESELPEMEAYIARMDQELSKTILANSFEQAPKQLDSDDDDDNDENDLKYNAVSNILKSLNEEIEITDSSNGVGPATALFAFMNQQLSDDLRKKET